MPTDWEAKYQASDTPWDKGAPSPGLVDFLRRHPELPRGRVLIPGCGMGHDARAWAEAGFQAQGMDIAPSAVRRAEELTGLQLPISFVHGDFLTHEPTDLFDWVFEHTLYCAIDPSHRATYEAAVSRWLKPGGHFLAVHYLIPDTDGPPFGTDREEVVTRFSGGLELVEEWTPPTYPHRAGLERMFWWRKPRALMSCE